MNEPDHRLIFCFRAIIYGERFIATPKHKLNNKSTVIEYLFLFSQENSATDTHRKTIGSARFVRLENPLFVVCRLFCTLMRNKRKNDCTRSKFS